MRITIGVGLELDRRGLSEPASTSFSSHEASGGRSKGKYQTGRLQLFRARSVWFVLFLEAAPLLSVAWLRCAFTTKAPMRIGGQRGGRGLVEDSVVPVEVFRRASFVLQCKKTGVDATNLAMTMLFDNSQD